MLKSRPLLLYGGLALLAGLASTVVNGGVFYTFGVFFKPVMEDMGWSRSQLSAVNTLFLISYAPGAVLLGRLSDRYGARLPLAAATLLISSGLALSSQVQGLGLFLFNYALIGLGVGATLAVPISVVQRWFVKGRGTALGIVSAGTGLGALIFSPLANQLISSYGWRSTYLILALVFGALLAFSALFLFSPPRDRELPTNGEPEASPTGEASVNASTAMRSSTFRGLVLTFVVSNAPLLLFLVHLVPYATDRGISPAEAARAMGLIGAMSIVGRVVMGSLGERMGWMRGLALSHFVCALTIAWLMALRNTAMLYPFVLVFGFFYGARVPQLIGGMSFFFGTASLGTLLGITFGLSTLVGSVTPLLGGYLFDLQGSYTLAWLFAIASFLASGIYPLLLRRRTG